MEIKKRTHCKKGHLFDKSNTSFDKKRGVRYCKICKNKWQKEYIKQYRLKNPEKTKIKLQKSKLKQYGLTIEKYNEILLSQFGVCAICNKQEKSKHQVGTINSLAVDHNHITGKIRGLLCSKCNMGIGFLNDDPTILMSAIKYLNKEYNG